MIGLAFLCAGSSAVAQTRDDGVRHIQLGAQWFSMQRVKLYRYR